MDTVDVGRFILSFAFVVLLVFAAAWLTRKLGLEKRWKQSSEDARLKVVDSLMIDPRRRLVLIRRDAREHLVLLNASGDVVIESYDADHATQA